MKLINFRKLLIFSLLLIFVHQNYSISQFKLFREYETCLRPCTICQNTLYHLKFHSNLKCRDKECPGLVIIQI